MNAFHSYIRLGWKMFMAKICTYYVAWMSTNIHLTSAWIVSFFVSFIYSEIVSQIVSTLFVEQLHLLAIVCLAMKGDDATTSIIVAVLPEVCIHYSSWVCFCPGAVHEAYRLKRLNSTVWRSRPKRDFVRGSPKPRNHLIPQNKSVAGVVVCRHIALSEKERKTL